MSSSFASHKGKENNIVGGIIPILLRFILVSTFHATAHQQKPPLYEAPVQTTEERGKAVWILVRATKRDLVENTPNGSCLKIFES